MNWRSCVLVLVLLAPARAETPERGGRLVVGVTADLTSCNPYLITDVPSAVMAGVMFNSLLALNDQLELTGDLAEKWEVSPDGTAYTFWLRKGVHFHDGAELTADDVLWTVDYIRNPKLRTVRTSLVKDIVRLEKLSPYEVRVHYAKPSCPALSNWATLPILPRHVLEGKDPNDNVYALDHAAPVGTGPFRFGAQKTGEHATFRAFDGYFKGRPLLDEIVFREVPGQSTMLALLARREIDYANLNLRQVYRESRGDERFQSTHELFTWELNSYSYLMWNNDPARSPFFADRRVRQAMSYALDVPRIGQQLMYGKGRQAVSIYHPQTWAHHPRLAPYPHDPERARALLAEAGWKDLDADGLLEKDGRKFDFVLRYSAGSPVLNDLVTMVQADLKKVGVRCRPQATEWTVLDRTLLAHRDFDAAFAIWVADPDPDCYEMWHSASIPRGDDASGFNRVGFANAEADRLIEQGQHLCERAARQQVYFRLQEVLHDEAPFTFLFHGPEFAALDRRVRWHRDAVTSRDDDHELGRPLIRISPRGLLTEDFLTHSWIPAAER